MTLQERFDRHLAALGLSPGIALVAVSGGPDSLGLLALLAASPAAGGLSLQVAHADHGIHPESGAVAEAVQRVAARFGIPFRLARLELGPHASETTARRARYAWLERLADELAAEHIILAHHRDDQVETILMRVLHGSGPAGLAGMAVRRGRLVRPLLPFRRAELAEFLQDRSLEAWDDPANRDSRHLRAWLRTEILPRLRNRLPGIDGRLLALSRQAASERAAWDGLLERLPDLDLRVACDGVSVAASPLHGYDSSSVRALLGALGRRCGCLIGPGRAARIERLLEGGRSGTVAELGSGCAAELSFGRLRLFRGVAEPAAWSPAPVRGTQGELRAGAWRIAWQRGPAPDRVARVASSSWFPLGDYLVRPWRAGDRIRPLGGTGRRLVVRCMQDARIPRTQRTAWPVLEAAGTILWVPGACRSAELVPAPGSDALRIDAHLV